MIFSKKHVMYESEHTKFISELKKQNPHLDAGQVAGRALLWDKELVSLDEQERVRQSRLSQQAYPYQNKV